MQYPGACPGIGKGGGGGGPKSKKLLLFLFFFALFNFSGGGAQLRKELGKLYFRLKK